LKAIRTIFIITNILAALLLALSYFSPVINPYKHWIFGLFGLLYPFFVFINLFYVIFWVFRKKWWFVLSLSTLLLGWSSFSGIIGLKLPSTEHDNDKTIRVMSYNIRALSKLTSYPTRSIKENREKFAFFMEENKLPHVLCIQESTNPNLKWFKSTLAYPYTCRYPGYNSNTAILSVFPIEQSGKVPFDKGNGDCVWADINFNGTIIRFYSAHLHSNTISLQADTLVTLNKLEKEETYKGIKGMFFKYKMATRIRYQQALKIKNHAHSSPYPVVLCGDFNDTPQSFIYHKLSEGLKDAFKERGIGFGTTWAGNLPGLKIDYILVDPSIMVYSHDIYRRQFSDHYPVTATLLFNKSQK
jgi:endonuclease/exonuclease/phosphatase family metal-dependent hydrolase